MTFSLTHEASRWANTGFSRDALNIIHLSAAQEWSCSLEDACPNQRQGREGWVIHAIVWYNRRLQIGGGAGKLLNNNIRSCTITQQITWLLNMLCMYHTQLHIPHRNTHCAEMAEPLRHDKRRGGRKRWNINHRRGLYSSCRDNSDRWKILSFSSPETCWHSAPLYLDTDKRDHRHGCRSTSPSLSGPCLLLANVTWSWWEVFPVCSQPWRKHTGGKFGESYRISWCMYSLQGIHVIL